MADDGANPAAAPAGQASPSQTVYPYRFGEVGVMMGVLNRDQVREALNEQRGNNGAPQIGEIMVRKGWLTPRQLAAILVAQKRYRDDQERKNSGAASAPPKPAEKPKEEKKEARQRLGQFELIRKIGEGAMGQVYEALDTQKDNKRIAVKILPRNLAQDTEFLERFKREVKLMEQLQSPHIVAFHDAGAAGGYWYLAMELIEGGDLTQRLKREKRLPEPESIRIAKEMALALAHAHGKGMIHRDIKPDNVLLTKEGAVKISDFGLAKPTEDNQRLTAAGFSIGTPFYISPEQALGKTDVDHRCDLYGLGATLFHMITGKVPFEHTSSTQVMVMHVQNPAPDPRTLNPGISRGAAQVILKLLEKDPKKRFQSASELAEVLEKVEKGEPFELARTRVTRQAEKPAGFFGWLKRLFGR